MNYRCEPIALTCVTKSRVGDVPRVGCPDSLLMDTVNVDKSVVQVNPATFDDTVNVDNAVNVGKAVDADKAVNFDEDSPFPGRRCDGVGGARWGKGCQRGRR